MITANQIDGFFSEAGSGDEEEDWDYTNAWDQLYNEQGPTSYVDGNFVRRNFIAPFGEIEWVASWGGEGDGAETCVVFKVDGQLWQKSGYYSSWDENLWEGPLIQVEEYEQTVKRYRQI